MKCHLVLAILIAVLVFEVKNESMKSPAAIFYSNEVKIDAVVTTVVRVIRRQAIEIIGKDKQTETTEADSLANILRRSYAQREGFIHFEYTRAISEMEVLKAKIQHHSEFLEKSTKMFEKLELLDLDNFEDRLQALLKKCKSVDELIKNVFNLMAQKELTTENLIKTIDELSLIGEFFDSFDFLNLPIDDIYELVLGMKEPSCSDMNPSRAVQSFFHYLMVTYAKGRIFYSDCNMMIISSKFHNRKTLERTVGKMNEAMLSYFDYVSNPDDFFNYDVVDDENGIIEKASQGAATCLEELHCILDEQICNFHDVVLSKWHLFTIMTKQSKVPNDSILGIRFLNSKLDFIPRDIFHFFHNLTTLNVSSTQLKQLEPHYFKEATNLIMLNASHNEIEAVTSRTFIECPKLEEIYLSYNLIHIIHNEAFEKLPNLRVVELHNNKIKSLSFEAFSNLQLEYLTLNNNLCINQDFKGSNAGILTIRNVLEVDSKCGDNEFLRKIILDLEMRSDEKIASFKLQTEKEMKKLMEMVQKLSEQIEQLPSDVAARIF